MLVQLGKLTERQGTKRNYPALSFYRNWVVHAKLGNVKANPETKAILDRFDGLMRAGSYGTGGVLTQHIADAISLRRVEAEINSVFDSDPQFDRQRLRRRELLAGFPAPAALYVFVLLDIGTRRVVHWNVTDHPTAEWTIQQFRDGLAAGWPLSLPRP